MPLGLTAATSATDETIHKKMSGSGIFILPISNEEMVSRKQLSLLKNLVYWEKALVKQLKLKPKNKKLDFSVCY